MRPLIIDSSIWIEWLRGRSSDLRELARERVAVMPAIVALELLAGARERRAYRIVHALIGALERRRRLVLPSKEDFFLSGEALAELGWSASAKSNDALIVACARRIGAEILTLDADLNPLAKALSVPLVSTG